MQVGLIFGMVVALMVMAMVFVFGYQQFNEIGEIQETAEFKNAMYRLETAVDRVYEQSGDSSEKHQLTFPSSVKGVCFFPKYDFIYEKRPYSYQRLKTDIISVVDLGSFEEENELASAVALMRIVMDGNTFVEDKGQTLLIFFTTRKTPIWFEVDNLEPTKDDDGNIICVEHNNDVWLVRDYDNDGAWVDVQLP